MGSARRIVSRAVASAGIACPSKGRLELGNLRGRTMKAFCKRALDITIASAGLIVISPLLLIVAFMIRVTMGPPVFFRQVRPGYKTRPFTVFRFRRMMGDGLRLKTSWDFAGLPRFANFLPRF